ncbi:hypothetical protein B0A48_18045 [Cryoendolithus antarcticus]|uniref:UDENN domain-containing protein n=1 Tax=Cryoendolithus antarcticus TaxID=1507870 RepID=A0A1V8SB57_9PEZI|nr:hypothetical protein B0A48_18045 [Cryoendolithus antarcticus]
MATVLPLHANTNSTGSASTSTSLRQSTSSFPSSGDRSTAQSFLTRSADPSTHRSQPSNASNDSHRSSLSNGPLTMAAHRPPQRRVQKPIKSRYPADSMEKHVEYILVASFDIDRGSVMEHQYPGPVGGDEVMLAELMLPDQTHLRSQDWTIFFLHKDAEAEEEGFEGKRRKRRTRGEGQAEGGAQRDDEGEEDWDSDDEQDSMDGPPLVYVLNLVNTKTDHTVKRGAVVKAMAICTRHSFLHIYKPLLLLALEQYFAHPQVETLANLYNAVNGMDLSLMPRLNFYEQFILQASGAKDLFIEKFEAIIAQRVAENGSETGSQGSMSPALQQHPSRSRFGLPRDTHEFESVVHYAHVPVPIKIPVALSAETVGDFSLIKLITTFSTPHSTSPVPFTPTHPHLTTSGPNTHPIIVLLNALLTQKRVIFLGHNLPSSEVAEAVLAACALASGGMLQGFTRHAFPYTDLTKIDDLLKVPGFIAGVTNPAFGHKTEWWDVLCDISTGRMRISNKIETGPPTEGVTYFQQNPMAPSTMSASAGIVAIAAVGHSLSAGLGGNAIPTGSLSGDPTGDAAFMTSILTAINERHGENAIRTKFRLWIAKFTRLASAFEELVYGASALLIHDPSLTSPKAPLSPDSPDPAATPASDLPPEVLGHGYVWLSNQHRHAELAANATRIEGWRNTRSYYNFVQDLTTYYTHRPVKALDLQHLHDKLAKLRLGPDVSANIYLAICAAVQTEQEINQLLATIASGSWDARQGSAGMGQGLFYLALGLFHPRKGVREAVAGLLGRIREHEAGRHFWGALGRFAKVAWERAEMGIQRGENREV